MPASVVPLDELVALVVLELELLLELAVVELLELAVVELLELAVVELLEVLELLVLPELLVVLELLVLPVVPELLAVLDALFEPPVPPSDVPWVPPVPVVLLQAAIAAAVVKHEMASQVMVFMRSSFLSLP